MEPPSSPTNLRSGQSDLSNERAQSLTQRYFSVVGIAKKIQSTKLLRFCITPRDSSSYILQLARTEDERSALREQSRVLRSLVNRLPQLKIPETVPTTSGKALAHHSDSAGSFTLQLLRIPTTEILDQMNLKHQPWAEIGQFLAHLDQELLNIDKEQFENKWPEDSNRIDFILRFVHLVDCEELREMIQSTICSYRTHCQPLLGRLRLSRIHSNVNPKNLFVDARSAQLQSIAVVPISPLASTTPPSKFPLHGTITGIADFFDVQIDYLINELAVVLSNILELGSDLLESASIVVAAYHQVLPLQEDEIAILYDFVAIQWCTKIVLAAWKASQTRPMQPDPYSNLHSNRNDPQFGSRPGSHCQDPTLLREWSTLNRHLVHFHFRHACNFPAVPHGRSVELWLAHHHDSFSSVVDIDLKTATREILKYSKGEPEALRARSATSIDAYSQDLWQRMKARSIDVFVGRYLEDREIYQSKSYSTNIPGDRRSIHLGVDLFLPENRPVFAPIAGTVYSIQDNDIPLDYGPTLILSHTIPHLRLQFYTLYGHLRRDTLLHLKPDQHIEQGEQIACLGDSTENGNWVPHLHFQIMTVIMDLHGNFPGVASPREIEVWRQICIDPNLILGTEPIKTPQTRTAWSLQSTE